MSKFSISNLDIQLAEFCHATSNPRRALLIHILSEQDRTVSELVTLTGFSASNISQHLKLLRDKGVVAVSRDGSFARYRLRSSKVQKAMETMRDVFLETMNYNENMYQSEDKIAARHDDPASGPGGERHE